MTEEEPGATPPPQAQAQPAAEVPEAVPDTQVCESTHLGQETTPAAPPPQAQAAEPLAGTAKPPKVACEICGKTVNKKNLTAHKRLHVTTLVSAVPEPVVAAPVAAKPTRTKIKAVPVAPPPPDSESQSEEEEPRPSEQPQSRQRRPTYAETCEEQERAETYTRPLTRVDRMRLLAQSGLP